MKLYEITLYVYMVFKIIQITTIEYCSAPDVKGISGLNFRPPKTVADYPAPEKERFLSHDSTIGPGRIP